MPRVPNVPLSVFSALQAVENALGGTSVVAVHALRAMSDNAVYEEAERRGMIAYDVESRVDLSHIISDYALRQDLPRALREVEDTLSREDSRFIGFADDVARHYGRAP